MGSVYEYDTTAGNNTQTGGGVSVAEGVNAALVNNAQRDVMADTAKWRDVIGGAKTAGGSANAITLSTGLSVPSYADGQMFSFVAAGDNTGATTLNIDTIGAKAVRKNGDVALEGGEIVTGGHYIVQYDASANSAAGAFLLVNPLSAGLSSANTFTKTQTWTKGADVASATSLTLGDGNYFDITGTTTVATIATKGVGTVVKLHFDGILTLTNSADLVLPGGADITTAAGDEAEFIEYATGDWRCTDYQRASGLPLAAIDEDDMSSDSETKVPTQQSVKAYVDTEVASITFDWTYETPQATTSGTEFDFTGLTGASEIEMVLEGVSLSGTDLILIQLGDAGGIETTGYVGAGGVMVSTTTFAAIESTSGFVIRVAVAGEAANALVRISAYDSTGVDWATSHGGRATTNAMISGGGTKTLSAPLTQVRLTRSGSNTFDAGQVSLRWR